MPKVSIISVLFDCDRFLPDFFDNITHQSAFDQCELIYLRPDSSPGNEKTVAGIYRVKHPQRIRGVATSHDPGLYELWNLGIKLAHGEYITNANPDDRRSREHIARAVTFLDQHPEFDVCATAIACTHDPLPNWDTSKREANWFNGLEGEFKTTDLFIRDDPSGKLRSRNLPHCMPVWRKSLHERFGYFEEGEYGPSADWEFWLRVLSGGARAWLIADILGLYYINPRSYWRANIDAEAFDQRIVTKYGHVAAKPRSAIAHTPSQTPERLLNLAYPSNSSYGLHRHGWIEAVRTLKPLHSENGIFLEPFIEKKFHYGTDPGDCHSDCPQPHDYPWIGFLHCNQDTPEWFSKWLKPSNIFQTITWKESLPYCKGLFVLSTEAALWLKDWLDSQTNFKIPVSVVLHPTNFDVPRFQWDRFENAPRIVQIGHWVRKLNAIYFLQTSWPRILLRKANDQLPAKELHRFALNLDKPECRDVQVLDLVDDLAFDDLLCSSVVFCNLYTAAANNAVVECLSRSAPLLINRLPATTEYLGKNYPLFFSELTEASLHLQDMGRLRAAHDYLKEMDKNRFTYEGFLKSVVASSVYQGLYSMNGVR